MQMAPMENAAITNGMPFDEDMVSSLHSRSADTNDNIKRLQKKKNMLEKKFQSHQSTELKVSPQKASNKQTNESFLNIDDMQFILDEMKVMRIRLDKMEKAQEEVDPDTRYSRDCYSFMALNGPSFSILWYELWGEKTEFIFFLFGFTIYLFQIALFTLLLVGHLNVREGTNVNPDYDDDYWARFLPSNNSSMVMGAQIISLFIYLLIPNSTLQNIVKALQLFPGFSRFWYKFDTPVWTLRFTCLLRVILGCFAMVVVWVFVMSSTTVFEIVLALVVTNFVSGIDVAAFSLAESGLFGPTIKEETKRITNTWLPRKSQRPKYIFYWIVLSISALFVFGFVIFVTSSQASESKWVTQAFRVQFEGEDFQKLSGCFGLDDRQESNSNRFTYKHVGQKDISIGYCEDDHRWVLYQDNADSIDPCDVMDWSAVAISPKTDSFDISASFEESWSSSNGKPVDLFFMHNDASLEDLNCEDSLGDGICDSVFNHFDFEYDYGDCCAATCDHPSCGRDANDAFGTFNVSGINFPYCLDPNLVPMTILLNDISSSRDQEEWPGNFCIYDFDVSETTWRSEKPQATNFELECDGKQVLTVYFDPSMEGQAETVLVEDGADCSVFVRNTTENVVDTTIHSYSPCLAKPIWFVNYTIFHGSRPVAGQEILTQQSSELETASFKRYPDCYMEKIGDSISTNLMYDDSDPLHEAVEWLLEDDPSVSRCEDDDFMTRFDLVYLSFAMDPVVPFINRENHCKWPSITCGLGGQLEEIDLHGLGLKGELPMRNGSSTLNSLWNIKLYDNDITSIPANIGKMTSWQYLDLDDNMLSAIPKETGDMDNLKDLFLSGNNIEKIPPEIGQMSNLDRLHLSWNAITAIPVEMGQLSNLSELEVYDNYITSIPTEISLMDSLLFLYLDKNYIQTLPTELGLMTNLERLDLNENQLTSLPTEIGLMTDLERLYLDSNLLTSIPTEIGQLTNLQELHLANNPITSIPTEITQLTGLKEITLSTDNENNQRKLTCDDLPRAVAKICTDAT